MMLRPGSRAAGRLTAGIAAVALPVSVLAVAGPAAARQTGPGHDVTSPLEARRVDRVRLPKLNFKRCSFDTTGSPSRCADFRVPLDYDQPTGRTVRLSLVRTPATNPRKRIGALFVNFGGPGLPVVGAAFNPSFLDARLRERFDIVGVEPRGVGLAETIACFPSTAAAVAARRPLSIGFPVGARQERAWIAASGVVAKACGTTGRPLSAAVSTAEMARDLDVVRRALGERRLNFLAFSYGTQIAQVYANMFPDRVRAIVADGVIDPVAWTTGYGRTGRTQPVDYRLKSDVGAYRALTEYFTRCDKAGPQVCSFAGREDAADRFRRLAAKLRGRDRITVDVPGEGPTELTYATYVDVLLQALYGLGDPDVPKPLADFLRDTEAVLAAPPGTAGARNAALSTQAGIAYRKVRDAVRAQSTRAAGPSAAGDMKNYNHREDAFAAVLCSDSVNPADPQVWSRAAAAADRRAPYFGRTWIWQSALCADRLWTARDEDRYLGPFTRRTAAPLLFVGNYYDPATPYADGAVPADRLAPNSRLLTSDSWGHTAYGTSACVNDSVMRYLVNGTLPARGTVCVGAQPFESSVSAQGSTGHQPWTGGRPPVVNRWSAPPA